MTPTPIPAFAPVVSSPLLLPEVLSSLVEVGEGAEVVVVALLVAEEVDDDDDDVLVDTWADELEINVRLLTTSYELEELSYDAQIPGLEGSSSMRLTPVEQQLSAEYQQQYEVSFLVVDEHDFMPTPSLASVSVPQEMSASLLFYVSSLFCDRTTTYPDRIEDSTPSSSFDLYTIHDSCDRRYSDRDHSPDILCLPPWSSRRSLRHWDRKGHRSWRHWN